MKIQRPQTALLHAYERLQLKHTKSQACEAKGYYPLSLKCLMALYMPLMYSCLSLVCGSICTPQLLLPPQGQSLRLLPFSPIQVPFGTWPIWVLRPNSSPLWDLDHLGSEAPDSPGFYADPFALTRGVKVSPHRLVSHHGSNEAYKSQAHEAKGYYPLSLRCSMDLYMPLMYNGLFLVCGSICNPWCNQQMVLEGFPNAWLSIHPVGEKLNT